MHVKESISRIEHRPEKNCVVEIGLDDNIRSEITQAGPVTRPQSRHLQHLTKSHFHWRPREGFGDEAHRNLCVWRLCGLQSFYELTVRPGACHASDIVAARAQALD